MLTALGRSPNASGPKTHKQKTIKTTNRCRRQIWWMIIDIAFFTYQPNEISISDDERCSRKYVTCHDLEGRKNSRS